MVRRKQAKPQRHVPYDYKVGTLIETGVCKYVYQARAETSRSPFLQRRSARLGVGFYGILTPYKSRDHVRRYVYSDDDD